MLIVGKKWGNFGLFDAKKDKKRTKTAIEKRQPIEKQTISVSSRTQSRGVYHFWLFPVVSHIFLVINTLTLSHQETKSRKKYYKQ